jgi:tetratricopeptide (TPR) repeat protein
LKTISDKKEEIFNKLSVKDLCNVAIREFGKEKKSISVYRYLNRAIELQPDYALLHYWKGLYWLDDFPWGWGAIKELERAIELGYNNADVYYWLGESYYLQLLNSTFNIRFKNIGINEKNEYVKGFNNLFREAVRALNKAIELKPDHKNSYLVLGDIYRINSQFDIAQDNYKKASSIRKSTSLESDKYMGRYYHFRREHNGEIYDFLRRRCDDSISTFQAAGFSDDEIKKAVVGGDLYPCSWLSVTRE